MIGYRNYAEVAALIPESVPNEEIETVILETDELKIEGNYYYGKVILRAVVDYDYEDQPEDMFYPIKVLSFDLMNTETDEKITRLVTAADVLLAIQNSLSLQSLYMKVE